MPMTAGHEFESYCQSQPIPASRPVDEEVAEELQLSPELSVAEIHRIRRRFASRHHPDKMGGSVIAEASHRMALANRMIDEALRAVRGRKDGRDNN